MPLLLEAPLDVDEPFGASKLMRAPRLYCGVALSKSFSMCITVEMSRFGRPKRSCRAGLSVPEKVPE